MLLWTVSHTAFVVKIVYLKVFELFYMHTKTALFINYLWKNVLVIDSLILF